MFGDVALLIVLAIWAKELTDSNSAAGIVFLLISIPALVAPLSGVIIDRFPRRHVMIANDLATGLAVLSLVMVQDSGDVWIIYAVATIYGLSQQIFFAARSGLLVSMLPEAALADANGLLESARQGLRIVGPLVGAALFAFWGGAAVAILDSATFFASAACLAIISTTDIKGGAAAASSLWHEVTAGARHIFATPEIRAVVLVTAAALCVLGLLEVAFFALVEALGRPPEFVGVLGTVQGAGAVVGGFLAPVAIKRLGEARVTAVGLALCGIGFGVEAIVELVVAFAGAATIGVGVSLFMVGYMTLLQRRTSPALQGRVFTAAEAIDGDALLDLDWHRRGAGVGGRFQDSVCR